MNAMNGILPTPQELMRTFCQTITARVDKRHHKLSKHSKDKTDANGAKQESTDDFKDYAETTMNELLGWYGYEKLDVRDRKNMNLKHLVSKKKSDSLASMAANTGRNLTTISGKHRESTTNELNRDEGRLSPHNGSDSGGVGVGTISTSATTTTANAISPSTAATTATPITPITADSTGVCRSPPLTISTESNCENGFINKDCSEDNQNIPPGCIVCAWCAKVGMKLFTLRTANGCKAFCSELCFTQCRRASFKKNKICDWCKHVRHTVNYVDFQDGEQQLQFCSNKCLNQYKMNIFCNEAKAHLHLSPTLMKDSTTKATPVSSTKHSSNLITPELWLNNTKNGENDGNSVHSFMDSSDSDLELELDDSQPMNALPLKRRFSELSKECNDIKATETPKDDKSLRDKSPKESKRTKHLHKSSASSRHTPNAKHTRHSNPELLQKSEWPSKESSADKLSPNYHHSPTYRPNPRPHSPAPPVVPASVSSMRTSMVANNHNIPQLLSQSVATPNNRSGASFTPMLPNGSPTGHLFPRLPGSIARGDHQIRAPLMPTPGFGARVPPPMPHNMFGAQMEMLLRMQSSFAGLRPPLPPFLPPHPPPNAHSFPGLSHFNGLFPPTGGPQLQPPYQTNGPPLPAQMFPNFSLLPPMTVMVPYPVPLPIPIPIPIPLLFPIDKNSKTENTNQNHDKSKHCNNHNNNQTNISSSNDVTTTSHNSNKGVLAGTTGANVCPISTASKVESVISKLVERKTKANNNTNNNNINENNIIKNKQKSANSMRGTDDNNSSQESEEQMSDSSGDGIGEEVPQNLVLSRDNHRRPPAVPSVPPLLTMDTIYNNIR